MTSDRSVRSRPGERRWRPGRASVLGAGLLLGVAFGVGCADFERGGAKPDASDAAGDSSAGDGGAQLSFAADVNGLLTATCAHCHVPGEQAGDTQFLLTSDAAANLAAVMPFVDTSAPAASPLLAKMSGQTHGGGTVYAVGSPEYEIVLRWIQEGALP